jgi:hypothetical protein
MSRPATTAARKPSAAAVWAPWLAAPLFALLPIGGCGLAGGLKPATAQAPPATTAAAVPGGPVVPVVPDADRQVAWLPAAD